MYEDLGEKPIGMSSKNTPGNKGAFSSGANNTDYKNERSVKRMPPPRSR